MVKKRSTMGHPRASSSSHSQSHNNSTGNIDNTSSNSSGPNSPSAPTRGGNNKRRRTMFDSVAEVAKWLLPSWASEHETGEAPVRGRAHLDGEDLLDRPSGSGGGGGGGAGGERGAPSAASVSATVRSSTLSNGGDPSAKRARLNDLQHAASIRRETIGRLSPVASLTSPPAPPPPSQRVTAELDGCDMDDGSDSSTSGCSSLSLAAATTSGAGATAILAGGAVASSSSSSAANATAAAASSSSGVRSRPSTSTSVSVATGMSAADALEADELPRRSDRHHQGPQQQQQQQHQIHHSSSSSHNRTTLASGRTLSQGYSSATAAASSADMDNGRTRDVSIAADQTSIIAETSVSGATSMNFSLFSRPSRGGFSSTLNSTLPLTNAQNRLLSSSLQKPERSLNRSIFYDGKTTYGGAAAHRKLNLFGNTRPYAKPVVDRKKPASNVSAPAANGSAKRLIQALERINTPVQNAKRIPMGRSQDSIISQDSEVRRREALDSIASFRQNMPPSLSSCRSAVGTARIGVNVSSVPQTEYIMDFDGDKTSSPALPLVTSTPSTHYRSPKTLSDTLTMDKGGGGGGKMKTAKSIHSSRKGAQALADDDSASPAAPDLPMAPLPIKALPSFSFASKSPATTTTPAAVPSAGGQDSVSKSAAVRSPLTSLADFSNKPFEKSSVPSVCPTIDSTEVFTFAGPVSLAKPTEVSTAKEEEFKFKHPLYLSKSNNSGSLNKVPAFTMSAPTMSIGSSTSLKLKETPKAVAPTVSSELATGTVLDALGCPPKDDKSTPISGGSDWGSQFRRSTGQWDCPTCLVTNKVSDERCVACETKKPASSSTASNATKSNASLAEHNPASSTASPIGLGGGTASGAAASKTEECPPAKLDASANDKSQLSVTADSLPAPISKVTRAAPFGGKFLMSSGWECSVCLVRNTDVEKCVACESPKPGQKASSSATSNTVAPSPFKFGMPSTTTTSTTGAGSTTSATFNVPFGQPAASTQAQKSDNAPATGGFKFGFPSGQTLGTDKGDNNKAGDSGAAKAAPGMFGAPKDSALPVNFGMSSSGTSTNSAAPLAGGAGSAQFKFGAPSTDVPKLGANDSTTEAKSGNSSFSSSLFSFGTAAASNSATAAASTSDKTATTSTFTFGVPVTSTAAAPAASTPASAATPIFTFGAPKTTTTTPVVSSTGTTVPTFGAPLSAGTFAVPTSTATISSSLSSGPAAPAAPAVGALFGPAAVAATVTKLGVTTPSSSAPSSSSTASSVAATAAGTLPTQPSLLSTSSSGGLFGASQATTVTSSAAASSQPPVTASGFTFAAPISATAAAPSITSNTSVASTSAPAATDPSQGSRPLFTFGATTANAANVTTSAAAKPAPSSTFVFGLSSSGISNAGASGIVPNPSSGLLANPSTSTSSGYPFGVAAAASPSTFTFGQKSTTPGPAATTATTNPADTAANGGGAAAATNNNAPQAFGASGAPNLFGAMTTGSAGSAAAAGAANSSTLPAFGAGVPGGGPFQFGASSTGAGRSTPTGAASAGGPGAAPTPFVFNQTVAPTGAAGGAPTNAAGPGGGQAASSIFTFGAHSTTTSAAPANPLADANATRGVVNGGSSSAPTGGPTPFGFGVTVPSMATAPASNAAGSSEMFKFGTTAPTPAPATLPFQFGSQQPPATGATSTPFQFGAAATPAAPNLNQFMASTNDNPFNVPIGGTRRVVKRAVRRKAPR